MSEKVQNPVIKKAREELLRIADEIEKEAWEKIFFSCDSCDHKANLATINAKRKTAAESVKENGKEVIIAAITVEDKIYCPQCDSGKMAYVASEESEKYLVEAEDESEKDYDEMKEEKEEKNSEASKKEDEEVEAAKEVEASKEEEEEDEENAVIKKASQLGLDLEAVARYSSF